MKIKLSYFKRSGKWYTEGEYQTELTEHWEVVSEIKKFQCDGILPGLVKGSKEFDVLIEFPDKDGWPSHMVYA